MVSQCSKTGCGMRPILLSVCFCLAACGTQPAATVPPGLPANVHVDAMLESSNVTPLAVGQPAPLFQWTNADGTIGRLADYRGKRVVVNFWATWCEPCRAEMPALDAYNDRDDVVVLGINKGQDIALIAPFAQELNVSFPLISDPDGDVSIAYSARNLPTSVFIDRNGTIAAVSIGVLTEDALALQLERLP